MADIHLSVAVGFLLWALACQKLGERLMALFCQSQTAILINSGEPPPEEKKDQ